MAFRYKSGGMDSIEPAVNTLNAKPEPLSVDPRLIDHAKNILQAVAIDSVAASSAWDLFYDAKSAHELATRLQPLALPDDINRQLIEAKKLSDPGKGPMDRVFDRMMNLSPATLDLAERHPTILRILTDAATRE
jgi:hypothetical protein